MDTKELAERLERARGTRTRLSNATDGLNTALEAVERGLDALRLGVTARVPLGDDTPFWDSCLVFLKYEGKWRLAVCQGDPNAHDGWASVEPVLATSRERRLEVADALPALIDKLLQEAEQEIADVEARADKTREVAALLGRKS